MSSYFIFAGIGKIFIYLIQIFPFSKLPIIGRLFQREFLEELLSCDLCTGVWVYFAFAWVSNVNVELGLELPKVLSYFVTGAITSFLMHLITVGWRTKFSTYFIDSQVE